MPSYSRWINKFEIKPGAWVYVPSEKSISIGKTIKSDIEHRWKIPKNYYHLRPGGHIKALRVHLNNKNFIHLDIKQFFNSINRSRVTRCVKKYLGYEKARYVAAESTVKMRRDGSEIYVLPFGFIQSPLLASLCLYESYLGKYIEKTKKSYFIDISVYMDDIIISTKNIKLSEKIMAEIKLAADKSKFRLNKDKQEGPAAQMSAFNINLSHKTMTIKEKRFFEFVEVYNHSTNHKQKAGIKQYVYSVNKHQATQIK